MERFVIIGNGPAGRAAAAALAAARVGEVLLIGREHPVPFSRPGLIYRAMGAMRDADLELTVPAGVHALHGEVVAWSPEEQWVQLAGGRKEPYSQVIWALGAKARPFPGTVEPDFPVFSLQEWGDAQILSRQHPRSWGVVGGGLVGAELVEWGVGRGAETHWWVREPHLWSERLTEEESHALAQRVRGFGVHLHVSTTVHRLGRPVVTAKGEFHVEAAGVAIGVEPNAIPGEGYWLESISRHPNAHAIGDLAPDGPRSWEAATRAGRELGMRLAGMTFNASAPFSDDRTRCFDRTVTTLTARPPSWEVGMVELRSACSLRLGFDEQGRWVRAVAMGWKLRSHEIKAAFAAGTSIDALADARPFFNEPEGTRLPHDAWAQLLEQAAR